MRGHDFLWLLSVGTLRYTPPSQSCACTAHLYFAACKSRPWLYIYKISRTTYVKLMTVWAIFESLNVCLVYMLCVQNSVAFHCMYATCSSCDVGKTHCLLVFLSNLTSVLYARVDCSGGCQDPRWQGVLGQTGLGRTRSGKPSGEHLY